MVVKFNILWTFMTFRSSARPGPDSADPIILNWTLPHFLFLLSSLQGLATSGIFFIFNFFPLSWYPFNVYKKKNFFLKHKLYFTVSIMNEAAFYYLLPITFQVYNHFFTITINIWIRSHLGYHCQGPSTTWSLSTQCINNSRFICSIK